MLYLIPQLVINFRCDILGGVVYPIMLQHLFHQVGFGWGVRISGIISGSGCIVATLLTVNLSGQRKQVPCFDVKNISDIRFLLLAAGSCLVALGTLIILGQAAMPDFPARH